VPRPSHLQLSGSFSIQILLYLGGLVTDCLDRLLQSFGGDAELLCPAEFVVFAHVDSGAVLTASLLGVVGHLVLLEKWTAQLSATPPCGQREQTTTAVVWSIAHRRSRSRKKRMH